MTDSSLLTLFEKPQESSKLIDLLKDNKSALELLRELLNYPIVDGWLRIPSSNLNSCHITIPRKQAERLGKHKKYKAILIEVTENDTV